MPSPSKIVVKIGKGNPRYSQGARYCPKCRVSFYPEPRNVNLVRCLFCGGQLRKNPRRKKEKERYRRFKEIDPEVYLSE